MKFKVRHLVAAASAAFLSLLPLHAESPGYVDFGHFDAEEGETFVQVDLNGALLKLAAAFARHEEPAVADLIGSLERVRVNVLGLGREGRESTRARVAALRTQLDGAGWTRVVTVQDGNDDVAVFIKQAAGDALHGVVVTVLSSDNEAVLVNVVGDIDLDQIAELGERLNIEPLRELNLREV